MKQVPRSFCALILGVTLLFLAPQAFRASSLVSDPMLATIENVQVRVAGGGYDPIPGLEVDQLHEDMERRCLLALDEAGLHRHDSSPALFSVVMEQNHTEGYVALYLSVQLSVPGEPIGIEEVLTEPRSRAVILWTRETLDLVPVEKASERILFRLDSALDHFVGSVQSARARAMGPSPGEDGSRFDNDLELGAKVKSCVRTRSGGDPVLPDSIDESDVSDDVGEQLVALETSPVSLGGLAEFEDHREHPGERA